MEYKPNKKTGKTWVVLGFITGIAFLFWLLCFLGWGYLAINQLGLMVMMVADILIVSRHILNDYVYAINEQGYITVVRVYGKNRRILADIQISASDRIVSSKEDLSKYGRIDQKENFSISLFPDSTYYYIFMSGGKRCAMVLECGEDVAERFRQAILQYGAINDAKNENNEDGEDESED